MEPLPSNRRKRQGRGKQKMDASMEPGIWLGLAEDSHEHACGNTVGVFRCRTVRRMLPERQWSAEMFLGMRGAPWDTAKGTVVQEQQRSERVRFALLLLEVVRQPDSTLLTVAPGEGDEGEKDEPEIDIKPSWGAGGTTHTRRRRGSNVYRSGPSRPDVVPRQEPIAS